MSAGSIPLSSRWLVDSAKSIDLTPIKLVYLIYCENTSSKGTGFSAQDGVIVTAKHVVEGEDPANITLVNYKGDKLGIERVSRDPSRDLAILYPKTHLKSGLKLNNKNVAPGTRVWTWGYPLGYNGPAPLLSVGWLSGYVERGQDGETPVKHFVVNGAFNPGNSGGPLFADHHQGVVGVVVTKHVPIPLDIQSAMQALANNRSGLVFTALDPQTNKQFNFAESQLVAAILEHYKNLAQVMIGEAVTSEEVLGFIGEGPQ